LTGKKKKKWILPFYVSGTISRRVAGRQDLVCPYTESDTRDVRRNRCDSPVEEEKNVP